MRNKFIIALILILFAVTFSVEPIEDAIDTFAGASTETYSPEILDAVAGATEGSGYYYDYENEIEDDD